MSPAIETENMGKQALRASQVILTFGPGAIVDLPDDSVMMLGTHAWFPLGRPKRSRTISEPRLQAMLGVARFRAPPADTFGRQDIPFTFFPDYRSCPVCGYLGVPRRETTGFVDYPPPPPCPSCHAATLPARIVTACVDGHISDFPWSRWIHFGRACTLSNPQLTLKAGGRSAALSDLVAGCSCGKRRSLGGALNQTSMQELHWLCPGTRPWLGDKVDGCDKPVRALQRGASNIYFSVTRSALSIPPWSGTLQTQVAEWWAQLPDVPPETDWPVLARTYFRGYPYKEVERCIRSLLELHQERPSLRSEEYAVFDSGRPCNETDLVTYDQPVGAWAQPFLGRVTALSRLREVRALVGFSRIDAPDLDPTADSDPMPTVSVARLSPQPLGWYPATENRGEGIFITLDPSRLADWEALPFVRSRAGSLFSAYREWRRVRGLDAPAAEPPRLPLLHTLSHVVIRQLALDCGYSSSSLRERIYSSDDMAGILVSTSAADSDGSLGGLVRLSRADRFEAALRGAVEGSRLCSGDPLCREEDPAVTGTPNGAVCYSCAMLSETSCELGNRLLDRWMLVNMPASPESGYFDHGA